MNNKCKRKNDGNGKKGKKKNTNNFGNADFSKFYDQLLLLSLFSFFFLKSIYALKTEMMKKYLWLLRPVFANSQKLRSFSHLLNHGDGDSDVETAKQWLFDFLLILPKPMREFFRKKRYFDVN